MATQFIDSAGFDLTELFEPWQSGDPTVAATGFEIAAGTDLASIFAPLSVGSSIDHDTLFQIANGADLTTIFAKKGSRTGAPISAIIPATLTARTAAVGGTASINVPCSAAGGDDGPYTFAWSVVAGAATITNATAQTCTVSEAVPGTGQIQSTLKCHVSDGSGDSADSNNSVITFKYHAGGAGGCLCLDQWLAPGLLAAAVRRGTPLVARTDGGELHEMTPVSNLILQIEPCVRLVAGDHAVTCSTSTPFTLRDGGSCLAPDMLGAEVLSADTGAWPRVEKVEAIGRHAVARISLGGASYAGGERSDRRLFSHNTQKQ